MKSDSPDIVIRNTKPEDFPSIIEMTKEVYSTSPSWTSEQLTSHLRVFPEGQFVAVETKSGQVVGMAASLIVLWDDYDMTTSWRDFTDYGMFTNHDPERGHTLYGAEVMTQPSMQRMGVGKKFYAARRDLCRRLGLWRIRAGARLAGYYRNADRMTPAEYVDKVVKGELDDPTLSFQLKQGFKVIGVAEDYLHHDRQSLGHAAVIEWLNDELAAPPA